MYSTYDHGLMSDGECKGKPSNTEKVIIGGGPNRIGQGIEFDYCCCQASFSLKEMGFETVMINVIQKLFQQIMTLVIDYILNFLLKSILLKY